MKVLATLLVLCLTLTSFAQRRIEKAPGDDIVAPDHETAPRAYNGDSGKEIAYAETEFPVPNMIATNKDGILTWVTPAEAAKSSGLIFITTQEAKDVVRAMEILSAQASDGLIDVVSFTSFPDNRTELEKARENLARLEKIEYDRNQRAKDLAWARAVLEVWKEKIKEGK